MSVKYIGISGKEYYIGEKIAGGGEGTVYEIVDNNTLVAKIYKAERRSKEREEKLLKMVENKLSEEQLEEITWPLDVLYNNEQFVGYIMPKLKHTESLTAVYNTGTSGQFDLRHRLLTAINLCYAVETVHGMGQVCGDLNPQNICINLNKDDPKRQFQVTLVDTDSYHFTSHGNTYRCEVGLADYIAPELQMKMSEGMNLKNAPLPTFTQETDLFALAVHIFALLMNGCHPFACAKDVNGSVQNTMEQMSATTVKDSVVAPQPIENIRDGFFPFGQKKEGMVTPIYAPEYDALPDKLQMLFNRTFIDGYNNPSKRVQVSEWIDALTEVTKNLAECSQDSKHYYFNHSMQCPLCDVENKIMNKFGMVEPIEPIEPIDSPPIEPPNRVFIVWLLIIIIGIVGLLFVCVGLVNEQKSKDSYKEVVQNEEIDQETVGVTSEIELIVNNNFIDGEISEGEFIVSVFGLIIVLRLMYRKNLKR